MSTETHPLRLLALDTSTHQMSVGVSLSGCEAEHPQLWQHAAEGGAQASAGLIPAILDLLAQADTPLSELDALVWGHGPGAFTGLRTAAAVVQGLAYGTRTARNPQGLPVLGIDTLMAVAEEARTQWPGHTQGQPLTVTAVLDARMDEVYAATYVFARADQPHATLQAGPWLLKPEELDAHLDSNPNPHPDLHPDLHSGAPANAPLGQSARSGLLAGNAFELHGRRLPTTGLGQQPAWPTATALLRLAPALLAQGLATSAAHAQPLYVRDKVAQTTAERLPKPAPPATSAPMAAPGPAHPAEPTPREAHPAQAKGTAGNPTTAPT